MEYELTVQETSRQKEFSFYNIFWIFVAGGVIGCILETIWCCFVFGEYSSRSSNLFFSDQYRLGTWGSALYSAFEGKYGKQFRTDFSERLHNGRNV